MKLLWGQVAETTGVIGYYIDKIHSRLPGFSCDWDARSGARQLREVYDRIEMSKETFEFRPFTRLKQLEYLIRTKQIDDEFFWVY